MTDEQLTRRMRAASDAIGMPDGAQARHLEAISSALAGDDVIALASARTSRRRRVVASVVAAAMIAPAGLAAASDDAVPGDTLYGVKQLSERVQVLFDADVIARHRIEEIEALQRAGRTERDLYDEARAALMELDENHPLWERLSAATGTPADGDDDSVVADDEDRSDDSPATPAAVKAVLDLPDGSRATVTVESGTIVDIAAPSGWTATEIDGDEATLSSASYRVEIDLEDDGTLNTEIISETDEDAASEDGEGADGEASDPSGDDDDDASDSTTSDSPDGDERDDPDAGADGEEEHDGEPEDDDAESDDR